MFNTYPIDVIAAGHLCLDLLPEMATVTRNAMNLPGHLAETGGLAFSTGGAVSNVGLSLHKLGARVRLLATVGDDLIGHATADLIRRTDPALTELITFQAGAPSSYTIVLSPEGADRTFLHCPGVNGTFGIAQIDFSLLDRAAIFYLGYPTLLPRLLIDDGAELEAIYRRAARSGIVTALDMTLPDPVGPGGKVDWRRLLSRTLPFVDVFVPSIEEILFMLRREQFNAWRGDLFAHLTLPFLHDLAGELLAMGVAITGFKLGEVGMYLRAGDLPRLERLRRIALDAGAWAGTEKYHQAFAVKVVGTTGAGDSALAGLLVALLRGLTPVEAVTMACAVGAHNVEALDAISGIHSWEETQDRVRRGWPVRPEKIG